MTSRDELGRGDLLLTCHSVPDVIDSIATTRHLDAKLGERVSLVLASPLERAQRAPPEPLIPEPRRAVELAHGADAAHTLTLSLSAPTVVCNHKTGSPHEQLHTVTVTIVTTCWARSAVHDLPI